MRPLGISFYPKQAEWLQRQASVRGVSVSEIVRRLVAAQAGEEREDMREAP